MTRATTWSWRTAIPSSFRPASGPIVIENLGDGQCEVIKTTLITEPRAHIDKEREEKDWGRG